VKKSAGKKPEETEIKISVEHAAKTRALLRASGFRVLKRRVFEQNIVLDDQAGSLKARNLLLRVRTAGKIVTCTFKGKEIPGIHKRREEREFHADDLEECLALFRGIGYVPSLRYEKYRTEFARESDPGVATLDETPIGIFMELEGPSRWIDRTAKELGFSRADYVPFSYSRLFGMWCAERGIESNAMTFSRRRSR
jgi:adenylate cyclase class 2